MKPGPIARTAALLLAAGTAGAEGLDAGRLRVAIERLQVAGSALYLAAHPDDENTAMLAWLEQGQKVRAGYLALTRGDGGQNLIGTEYGDALGVLRTEELLAARRIDGAEQFFTRAIDFGYSKTPEETLRIWGHDAVLGDVVRVIRSFRPDVIITRFPTNGSGGHGHHTASALLAAEAFTAAADPARFPDQLASLQPWQAKRLVWNAWRRQGEPPVPGRLVVDLGAYDPLLGRSYAEVAAEARTMHKSQGFGSSPRLGSLPNDLQVVAGAPARADLFEGIDLTWQRFPGGALVAADLARALAEYRDDRPVAALPGLLAALDDIDRLAPDPLVRFKREEVVDVIGACLGLVVEASAKAPFATPGGRVDLEVTVVNRSLASVTLDRLELPFTPLTPLPTPTSTPQPAVGGIPPGTPVVLASNEAWHIASSIELPKDLPFSQPYWLVEPHGPGLYTVGDAAMIGRADSPAPLQVSLILGVEGHRLRVTVPVLYRWTDPVEGERTRVLTVVPPITVNFPAAALVVPDAEVREVTVRARARADGAAATLRLAAPTGWQVEPAEAPLHLAKSDQERAVRFTVRPLPGAVTGALAATLDGSPARAAVAIDHPHVEPRLLLPPAAVRLVRVDVACAVQRVGYVMGPGDDVPEVLRQLGLEVTLLSDDDLESGNLDRFQAIVTGVRAYNTRERLARLQDRLLGYVERGGTLVVQYATSRETLTDRLGPYPLQLSRDRVTDETAPVTLLAPDNPVLREPNRITDADFEGWVQERGLYFPDRWDERYTPLLAMADPGEKPMQGALLVARYGKGAYVFTGLAFFRQLPAGVPGAIRLFANLISAGSGGV